MLRSENGLTNVVVDTVTNLKLSDVACSQVQAKVMSRLDKCPIEFLPSLVQFILSKCSEDEYPRVCIFIICLFASRHQSSFVTYFLCYN